MFLTMLVGLLSLVLFLLVVIVVAALLSFGDDDAGKAMATIVYQGTIFLLACYQFGQIMRPWIVSLLQ